MQLSRTVSIKTKLCVVFTVVVGLISAFVYISFSLRQEKVAYHALREKARTVAEISALCVRQPFVAKDRNATAEIVKGIPQDHGLLALTVFDGTGEVFVASRMGSTGAALPLQPGESDEDLADQSVYSVARPITYHGQEVGRVIASISLEDAKKELRHSRAAILLISVLVFAAGMTAIVVLSRIITGPLNRFLNDVTRVANGDLSVRAKIRSRDELGQLAESFNLMVDHLENTQGEFEAINHTLEERVAERTQALEQEVEERKRAEGRAHELSERLLKVIETVNDGITFSTPDGKFEVFNSAMEGITGYTKAEANAVNDFASALYPDPVDHQHALDGLKEILEKRDSRELEATITRKDGTQRDLLISTSLVQLKTGNMFLSSYHDITERKQAEQKLHLLAQTVACTKDCVSITDLEDRFIFVNDAFLATYGYSAEEIVGLDTSVIRSQNTPADLASQILPATLAGGWYGEILNCRKDGTDFPVELWTSVVQNDAGKPVAMVGVARDISARKRAADRLSKLNECLLGFGVDPDDNVNRLVALCGEQLQATCALYNRIEGGDLLTIGAWNTPKNYKRRDKADGHICFDVIRNGAERACVIRDLDQTSYVTSDPNVLRYGLKTYMGKAVSLGTTAVGSLCVVYQHDREPGEEDIKLLEIAAYAIGVEEKRKNSELVLREAQRKLTTLVDNLPGVVYRCLNNKEWAMEYLSEGIVRLTGYSSDELIANRVRSYSSVIHEADRASVWETVQEALALRQQYVLEYRIQQKSGQERWVWEKGGAILGSNGEVVALEGFIADITERKRAEKIQTATYKISRAVNTTHNIEELYRAIHGILAELMVADNFYVALYDEVNDLLSFPYFVDECDEWSPPKRPGRGLTEYVLRTGESLLAPPEVFDQLVERGEVDLIGAPSIDWLGAPLKSHDRVIGVLVAQTYSKGVRFGEEDKRILEFVASQVAVAVERKYAEEHLERTVSVLQATLESTADGLLVVNNQGKIEALNKKFSELWRIPEGVLASRDDGKALDCVMSQLSHPGEFIATVKKLYSTPEAVSYDTLEFKDGRVFERFSTPQRIGEETVGRVWSFRDVTERRRAELELLLQKTRFEQLYENIPLGIAMLDEQGRVIQVNRAFESIFNYSSREIQGALIDDLVVPADRREEARDVSRTTFDCERVELESIRKRKDGSLVHVHLRGIPIQVGGKRVGIYGVYEDISERKRADEQLRQSEEMFRLISENAGDLIAVIDLQGNRLYNSPSYKAVLGDPADLVGSNSFAEIHPEDKAKIEKIFRETIETGAGQRTEYRFLLNDRSVRYIESQGSVVKDAEGKAKSVVVLSRDITERKRAEERIREQAALLDIARDAIIVRDLEGTVVFWNKGAERLYGWAAGEVSGRKLDQLLMNPDSPHSDESERAILAKGEWVGEIAHITHDQHPIDVESRWTLVRDERGAAKAILIVNTDITEKKHLESQFRRSQRMEIVGTLAGGIAHDLNNVLAPILMALSMLKSRLADEKNLRLLGTLETSALRGADIIKQVLTFARGVEGDRVVLQPRHLMREIEKIGRETFPRNIEIEADIPKELATISGDATQLHQVLMNLSVNARDAMPHGGLLSLQAENIVIDERSARLQLGAKPGVYVGLMVADSGTGIPKNIIDKIFDPFFTTKPVGKGTGLGLATVQAIVKSHGGFLTVTSEEGKGTAFKIYLPATDSAVSQRAQEAVTALRLGHGELVLVIDDETSIREIAKETLENYGYEVLTAQDGAEAIALYKQHAKAIDVVLTDMMMPNVDGATVIKMLRALDPGVRIVAASGLAETSVIDIANVSVQAFITKPFTADKLLSVLDTVLHKS